MIKKYPETTLRRIRKEKGTISLLNAKDRKDAVKMLESSKKMNIFGEESCAVEGCMNKSINGICEFHANIRKKLMEK